MMKTQYKSETTMKALFIIITLAVSIMVTSCSSSTPSAAPLTNYRSGSDGMAVTFVSKMPPQQIKEKSTFGVGIQLSNKGAYDINNGILVLSGYDPSLVTINQGQGYSQSYNIKENINLQGKSGFNPTGSMDMVFFEGSSKELPASSTKQDITFVATMCYPYETIASSDICIITDVANLASTIKPVCAVSDVINIQPQGAPVNVAKIEPTIFNENGDLQAKLKIYVVNSQKGEVRSKDSYFKDCKGPALKTEDVNRVLIQAYIGNKKMDCPDYVIVISGKDTNYAECTTTIDRQQQNYLTTLRVVLDYGYVTTQSNKVTITKE